MVEGLEGGIERVLVWGKARKGSSLFEAVVDQILPSSGAVDHGGEPIEDVRAADFGFQASNLDTQSRVALGGGPEQGGVGGAFRNEALIATIQTKLRVLIRAS